MALEAQDNGNTSHEDVDLFIRLLVIYRNFCLFPNDVETDYTEFEVPHNEIMLIFLQQK